MAAAALVQLAEGEKAAMDSAIAFAMMNLMGLVCDPVKGLVEVPCVYRNVIGVANALTAADMAAGGHRFSHPGGRGDRRYGPRGRDVAPPPCGKPASVDARPASCARIENPVP